MSLKPQNLIQAAQADFARRERNVARHIGARSDPTEPYAFYAPHVRRATDIKHLMLLAIKNRAKVVAKSRKKNTRVIYSDAQLLVAAVEMMESPA